MKGPIDYIIVGFEGNKFDGSILQALADAIDKDIIKLLALAVIAKDNTGTVTQLDITELGNDYIVNLAQTSNLSSEHIAEDDITEMADLIENNTAAGLLVIEQLWAKPLKQALIDANGVLVAEGRIHPEAAQELENKEDK